MPCSLYQILEDDLHRISLPEILDVTLDVIAGLDYLHSHNPPIIHRDISSKNILLGGNKAKIADLGQAKIFGKKPSPKIEVYLCLRLFVVIVCCVVCCLLVSHNILFTLSNILHYYYYYYQ